MAVTTDTILQNYPRCGTQDGRVIQHHLDIAEGWVEPYLPVATEDSARRDSAVIDLWFLSFSPKTVLGDGDITYIDRDNYRNKVLRDLVGITITTSAE